MIHRFDKESGLLFPSVAEFKRAPSALAAIILKVLSGLGFIRVATNKETGLLETTNLTILNVFLVRFGPMREDTLVKVLISSQVRIARIYDCSWKSDDCRCRLLAACLRLLCGMVWRGFFTTVIGGRSGRVLFWDCYSRNVHAETKLLQQAL